MENRRIAWAAAIAVLSMTALSGCGTATAIVPDAEGEEHVSAIGIGCSKPYDLEQDCSGFSGPTRLVEISGFRFKTAATADGSVVLMMGAKPMSDSWTGKSSETANLAYELTKKLLVDNGFSVNRVEPVSSGPMLAGYLITTSGDAYSLLKQSTVEDD